MLGCVFFFLYTWCDYICTFQRGPCMGKIINERVNIFPFMLIGVYRYSRVRDMCFRTTVLRLDVSSTPSMSFFFDTFSFYQQTTVGSWLLGNILLEKDSRITWFRASKGLTAKCVRYNAFSRKSVSRIIVGRTHVIWTHQITFFTRTILYLQKEWCTTHHRSVNSDERDRKLNNVDAFIRLWANLWKGKGKKEVFCGDGTPRNKIWRSNVTRYDVRFLTWL